MRCFGCQRVLEVGDHYIEDTASGFIDQNSTPEVDRLIADLFGGKDDKVIFCEDCTTTSDDGKYRFETVYGDEEERRDAPR